MSTTTETLLSIRSRILDLVQIWSLDYSADLLPSPVLKSWVVKFQACFKVIAKHKYSSIFRYLPTPSLQLSLQPTTGSAGTGIIQAIQFKMYRYFQTERIFAGASNTSLRWCSLKWSQLPSHQGCPCCGSADIYRHFQFSKVNHTF